MGYLVPAPPMRNTNISAAREEYGAPDCRFCGKPFEADHNGLCRRCGGPPEGWVPQ